MLLIQVTLYISDIFMIYNNKKMKFADHVFGFNSSQDLFNTLLGLKNWLAVGLISFFGAVTSFITSYVYNDVRSIGVLVALLTFDVITGIVKSYTKRAEQGKSGWFEFILSIKSNRLMRGFLILVLQICLLAICWNIGLVFPLLSFLSGLVYFGLATTQIISISENLYEAKIIKFNLPRQIKEKVKGLFEKKKEE